MLWSVTQGRYGHGSGPGPPGAAAMWAQRVPQHELDNARYEREPVGVAHHLPARRTAGYEAWHSAKDDPEQQPQQPPGQPPRSAPGHPNAHAPDLPHDSRRSPIRRNERGGTHLHQALCASAVTRVASRGPPNFALRRRVVATLLALCRSEETGVAMPPRVVRASHHQCAIDACAPKCPSVAL